MDSSELRSACEMAGMQITDQPGGKWHAVTPFAEGQIGADVFVYKQADPALKPYAAELLTAKLRKQGKGALLAQELNALTDYAWSTTATAEQRISACMAALRGGR